MKHVTSLESLHLNQSWVTIGSFDGVHRGHQALIGALVEQAHAQQQPAVVVTFFPHPVVVLKNITSPFYLTSAEERASLLGSLGVDIVVTLDFTRELAETPAPVFMQQLASHLGAFNLLAGSNFVLGRNRDGDIPALTCLGASLGFKVTVVEPITQNEIIVSSSAVRQALQDHDVALAAGLLGRPYSISGTVVEGDRRGRELGFPTANLVTWEQHLLPSPGVYVTRAHLGSRVLPSVTNTGTRPTFSNASPAPHAEVYILDFDEDLYGQTLQIDFLDFIRPEQHFSSRQDLIRRINLDVSRTREVFRHVS